MTSGRMYVVVVDERLSAEDHEALGQAGVEWELDASGATVLRVRADDPQSARLRVVAALGDREDVDVCAPADESLH